MGSSAAWQLASSGQEVLLLEKQDSVYKSGSSLGEARIARKSNRGSDMWSYLHTRTVDEVIRLITYLNEDSQGLSYKIEDIYTTSTVSYLGRSHIYDRLMASLIRQDVDYKIASDPVTAVELFDVTIPDSVVIQREYNRHSGTINPQRLIRYLHDGVRKHGSEVAYNAEVSHLRREGDHFLMDLKKQDDAGSLTIAANRIVVAAGPYTAQLLGTLQPKMESLINPQRVFLTFFKINPEIYHSLAEAEQQRLEEGYPVINSSAGTRMGSFFSMIEYYDEDEVPVIKIGGHFQRSPIDDLNKIWSKELTKEEKEWSFNNTFNYLRLLNIQIDPSDLEYSHGYSCVYSLTETEVPVVAPAMSVDGQPDPTMVIMAGMSGVGAKGSLAYGKIASDILLERKEVDSMYQVVRQSIGFDRLK